MKFYENYAIHETENEIGIYIPGGDGWFRYAMRHIVKPFTDGGTHQNQDLWRLHKLMLCRRVGDGFENIYDFPLTTSGEWECAVKIEGTPDFHGGFHGYEHQNCFTVTPEANRLLMMQESRIVLQGTKDEPVAFHRKEYEFKDGLLTVRQHLKWERAVHINRAFMTMLPIRRKEEDFLITDTALYKGEEYDISMKGHKTPLSPGCKEKIYEMTVFGKESGITATVTSSFCDTFSIQNTEAYNKVYFSFARDSHVAVGDEWDTVSTFRLSYRKPE